MQQLKIKSQKIGKINRNHFTLFFSLANFLDYIAIVRPLLLIPVWTMLLLGYYMGIDKSAENLSFLELPVLGSVPVIVHPHIEILVTLFAYSFLMSAVYVLNQLTDSHTDEMNKKLYLISHGYVRKNVLRYQIVFFLLISIVISLIKFDGIYIFLIVLSIVLGIIYSVPPIRLKGKPFLDLVANAAGFGVIAFLVGWTSKSKLTKEALLYSLPYFFSISAAFINTTIPDMEGDAKNGDITTGVFLGIRKSCIASTSLVSLAILLSSIYRDWIILLASLVSFPFFIYMTISNCRSSRVNVSSILLTTKVSLLALSVLTCFVIPVYFVPLILTILLTRLYYQFRLGINYP